jgi:hypothetical protein
MKLVNICFNDLFMSQKLGVFVNITFSKIIQLCLSSSSTHFGTYFNLVQAFDQVLFQSLHQGKLSHAF